MDEIEELPVPECWALLRTAAVGRLAVWAGDHPEIFPINYVVDHGAVVFRSGEGTKVSRALSDAPVAMETDGYDPSTSMAWSVVLKGTAQAVQEVEELLDTVDLGLFPWQAGEKNRFIRIVPTEVTGRRFPVADPEVWRTSLTGTRRSPGE